jgi:hypothetical protein
MAKKKYYLYNSEKDAYAEVTDDNKQLLKDKQKSNPDIYSFYEVDDAPQGGGDVGKQQGSTEPLEQSQDTTTTPSSETPSPTQEQSGTERTKEGFVWDDNDKQQQVKLAKPQYEPQDRGYQIDQKWEATKTNIKDVPVEQLEQQKEDDFNRLTDAIKIADSYEKAVKPLQERYEQVTEELLQSGQLVRGDDGELQATDQGALALLSGIEREIKLQGDPKAISANITNIAKDVESSTYKEYVKKAEDGNIFGLTLNNILGGTGESSAGTMEFVMPLIAAIVPEESRGGMSIMEASEQVSKDLAPSVRTGLKEILGSKGTTEEYVKEFNKSFLGKAYTGVTKSLVPSLLSKNPMLLVGLGVDQASQMVDDKEDLTPTEKYAFKSVYGIFSAAIEKMGIDAMFTSKGAINNFINKFIKESAETGVTPSIPSATSFLLKSIGEGSTEAVQQGGDWGSREVINAIKDKEIFEPKAMSEELMAIGENFALGTAGGAMMMSPIAIYNGASMMKNGLTEEQSDAVWKAGQIVRDPDYLSNLSRVLKAKVDAGDISQEQMEEALENSTLISEQINSIDPTIPIESQKEVFNLINERDRLQKETEGLEVINPAKKQRIDELNEQIKNFGQPTKQPTETSTTSKTDNAEVQQEDVIPKEITNQVTFYNDNLKNTGEGVLEAKDSFYIHHGSGYIGSASEIIESGFNIDLAGKNTGNSKNLIGIYFSPVVEDAAFYVEDGGILDDDLKKIEKGYEKEIISTVIPKGTKIKDVSAEFENIMLDTESKERPKKLKELTDKYRSQGFDFLYSSMGGGFERTNDIISINPDKIKLLTYDKVLKDKQDAKEQQGGAMRVESKPQEPKGESNSNLPEVNETKLQDGKKEEVKSNEDIFLPNKTDNKSKILSYLDKARRRFLSARRFLPKSAFELKEEREANIAKELNQVEYTVKDFNRAFKGYDGDKDLLIKRFDDFIRGVEVELPDNFIKIGNDMRNQIDALSMSLINNGYVNEFQSETIKSNIGEYINRSYEVFDNENWKGDIMKNEPVVQAAKNFLKGQMLESAKATKERTGDSRSIDEILDILVDQKIDELLTKETASGYISGGRLGSKDTKSLKQRKDVPQPLRALMGEYTDPVQNYARTMLKMSGLVANAKFLNDVRAAGMGTFLFEKNDINRPVEFNTEIASAGSESMNPLNGLYTTKEIANEFNNPKGDLTDIQEASIKWLYVPYMRLISSVKWAKTIGSLATHSKNIVGNIGFMAINGHYRIGEMQNAFNTVINDFNKSDNQQLREKMSEYISLGIVKQSAGVGEIMDMFKDAELNEDLFERLTNRKLSIAKKAKVGLLNVKKKLEDAYQAEDDFFKIVAYENELSRYSEAMFGKDKSQLTADEKSEVDKKVSEIVKNTYPTYSRVPELVQLIKKFPFVGNFVFFQAEAYRTMYNTYNLAKDEINSDNEGIRKIGAQRLAGIIVYEGVKDGILSYFGIAAGMGLSGVVMSLFNSDDEEQRERDFRRFVAPWSKESDLIILDSKDGFIRYIDFSASDPHGGIRQVFNSFSRGEDIDAASANAVYQIIEPFVGEEIATNAIRNILENDNGYGGNIYEPEDSNDNKMSAILAYAYKAVELGTLKTARRINDSEDKLSEVTASVLGFRAYDVDLAEQFGFKIKDYKERLESSKRIYNKALYKNESEEAVSDAYESSNESTKRILKEIYQDYQAAQRLGADTKDLDKMLGRIGSKKLVVQVKRGMFLDINKKTK